MFIGLGAEKCILGLLFPHHDLTVLSHLVDVGLLFVFSCFFLPFHFSQLVLGLLIL